MEWWNVVLFLVVLTCICFIPRFIRKPTISESSWVDAIPAAVLVVDEKGRIVQCNNQSTVLLEYTPTELLTLSVEDLIPSRFRRAHPGLRDQFLANSQTRPMGKGRDLYVLTKTGKEILVEISLGYTKSQTEHPLIIVVIADITERRRNERLVEYMAFHDALTDLPNRESFMGHAKQTISRARATQTSAAFLIVDVDDFKRINDTLGHHVGDLVLKEVGTYRLCV